MAGLDLSALLSNDSHNEKNNAPLKTIATTVLFSQSRECADLVSEAFRFEGYPLPEMMENKDNVISEYVEKNSPEIVLLELNSSLQVATDAERISHMLPNHCSVIVIGQEDAISTIRDLKELGFYYLFWPVTKQELIDFVIGVSENRERQRGPGQNRKAKYIGVYGSKGGVGTSLVASEVAFSLAEEKSAMCILVDHNYDIGNLDIMLAQDDLQKRELQIGTLAASLDTSAAKALANDISEHLSYLALRNNGNSPEEMRDLTDSMVELAAKDSNFVVEDLSASVSFKRQTDRILSRYDVLLVVIEPSVSSVREASFLLNELRQKRAEIENPLRILVVINQRTPERYNSMTVQEIEKYLQVKIDLTIPYVGSVDQMKLYQKHLYKSKTKAALAIAQLVKLIMGEQERRGSWLQKVLQFLPKGTN